MFIHHVCSHSKYHNNGINKKKRMKRKSYNSSKSTSGKSPTVTALGRTNAPYLSGHSKYFFPSTLK